MPRRLRTTLPFLAALIAACASAKSTPDYRPVRVAGMVKPVTHGDCPEARRRAAEKPDLDVDRLPTPIAMRPPALANGSIPPGVITAKGAIIKADVVIDTLGRADMKTFRIVKSSHPWLSAHIKNTLPKWKYSPAELAGCKVARVYHFSATAPPAKPAR
ncbi:MAG: hypothetical protein M3303_16125 [Gemmatimonadota bacterium]|nr:hypothetical protein [Gemmatimonadota bacterium]